MKPRAVTDDDLVTFAGERVTYSPPIDRVSGGIEVEPLELVRCQSPPCLRIPWVSDERDEPPFEGTLWFTVSGYRLPPVDGYVLGPADGTSAGHRVTDDVTLTRSQWSQLYDALGPPADGVLDAIGLDPDGAR